MEYTLAVVFDTSLTRTLLMTRKNNPYAGKLNGIGGKLHLSEVPENGMIRELFEEIPQMIGYGTFTPIVRMSFPSGVTLHCYASIINVPDKDSWENEEGIYNWYKLDEHPELFDVNNPALAGDGNIPYLLKEGLNMIHLVRQFQKENEK